MQNPNTNIDVNILVDWNLPFDQNRVEALDLVIDYMYRGGSNHSQVSLFLISKELCKKLISTKKFFKF